MTAPAPTQHREDSPMPKRRPRRPGRPARTIRHPAGEQTLQVDVMETVAAIIAPDPRTGETATLVLAATLLSLPKPTGAPVLREFAGDARQLVDTLRELHTKGWLGIEDGRAYLTRPIYGAGGELVDRVRISADAAPSSPQLSVADSPDLPKGSRDD